MYGNGRETYTDYQQYQTYSYHTTGTGSVSHLTSQKGDTLDTQDYAPFGQAQQATTTDNPYGYNSEHTHRNGLQYLRARYYDSDTATFLTEDSYGGTLTRPSSQNRYSYVEQNPTNYHDPSGHMRQSMHMGWVGEGGQRRKAPTVSRPTPTPPKPKPAPPLPSPPKPKPPKPVNMNSPYGPKLVHTTLDTVYSPPKRGTTFVNQVKGQSQATALFKTVQAQSKGNNLSSWGLTKEGANYAKNGTKAFQQNITHFCTTADMIKVYDPAMPFNARYTWVPNPANRPSGPTPFDQFVDGAGKFIKSGFNWVKDRAKDVGTWASERMDEFGQWLGSIDWGGVGTTLVAGAAAVGAALLAAAAVSVIVPSAITLSGVTLATSTVKTITTAASIISASATGGATFEGLNTGLHTGDWEKAKQDAASGAIWGGISGALIALSPFIISAGSTSSVPVIADIFKSGLMARMLEPTLETGVDTMHDITDGTKLSLIGMGVNWLFNVFTNNDGTHTEQANEVWDSLTNAKHADDVVETAAKVDAEGSVLNKASDSLMSVDPRVDMSGLNLRIEDGRLIVTSNLGNDYDITPTDIYSVVDKPPSLHNQVPNSTVDILNRRGDFVTRRFYDENGTAYRDVHMTNHGNAKNHPEYPHEHLR